MCQVLEIDVKVLYTIGKENAGVEVPPFDGVQIGG